MKLMAFILSIIILGLSTLPCNDSAEGKHGVDISMSDSGDDQQHDSNEDHCSPLCSCHCCHSHITNYSNSISVISIEFSGAPLSVYKNNLKEGFIQSFLQPPRA